MSRRTREGAAPDLGERLAALAQAVETGRGRVDPAALVPAENVLARAGARQRLSPERTVVALAGGTGSGKSTLFNALTGAMLAPTGVRRPMTSRSRAAIWPGGDGASEPLLDWLEVRDRHELSDAADLAGLVLIDLPDFDSTSQSHRAEADRLTGVVDLLIWVLDPQKYADAAVHERYLRPLRTHADVMLVVLNQVDRLDSAAAVACERHLAGLLVEDGLHGVQVVATSATRGDGLVELRGALAARVRARTAAVQRLHGDVDAAVAGLTLLCPSGPPTRGSDGGRGEEAVVRALGDAAGVPTVVAAVGASYRLRATARTGWPVVRWASRMRANPLRRLHLGPGDSGATSLPAAGGVQRAQVSNALREHVAASSAGLPAVWRASTTAVVDEHQTRLPAALDRAVCAADVSAGAGPRWWGGVNVVQWVLFAIALAGAAWLAVLAVLAYLQLPGPTLHVGRAPLPTVLLVGGLLLGALLAAAVRPFVGVGARRRQLRARRTLDAGVRGVAQSEVFDPLSAELAAAQSFRSAVERARRSVPTGATVRA